MGGKSRDHRGVRFRQAPCFQSSLKRKASVIRNPPIRRAFLKKLRFCDRFWCTVVWMGRNSSFGYVIIVFQARSQLLKIPKALWG